MPKDSGETKSNVSRISNLLLAFVWLGMVGIAYFLNWYYSVAFIAGCSIYANFASHVAAWRSDANPPWKRLEHIEQLLEQLVDKEA